MNSSIVTASKFVAIGLLGLVIGCADIVTYSKDSRKEGLRLLQAQEYADAAGAFRNATRQNPRDYQSYYYLGESYAKLTQWQQSIAAYRTSLDVMNTTHEGREARDFRENVLNGLAHAIASSDLRDSETNAVEQKAHERASAQEWYLLAKIYAFRGDADNAIEAYTRAELIDSNDFYIAKERGLYLEKLGQTAKAEPSLRRAYMIQDTDGEVIAALRRLGIVPGLSLKEERALAQPIVPKGPIPQPSILQRTTDTEGTAATPRD